MSRLLLLAAALVGIASVAQAAPAPAPATMHPGNAAAGRILVFTCHGCHGIPGYRYAYPNFPIPKIAGQHYNYLIAALNEYRKQDRANPTMQAQAQGLSEQDIRDIAAYLSSIRK